MKRTDSRGFLVAAAVLLLTAMPGPFRATAAAQQQAPAVAEPPPFPEQPFSVPDWAPLPDDLDVVILREDVIPGQFRILDVRLNHTVGEDTLAVLANLLRDSDEMPYLRTYIVYYLPGMESGDGGWATSHFTPDLEVKLLQPELGG